MQQNFAMSCCSHCTYSQGSALQVKWLQPFSASVPLPWPQSGWVLVLWRPVHSTQNVRMHLEPLLHTYHGPNDLRKIFLLFPSIILSTPSLCCPLFSLRLVRERRWWGHYLQLHAASNQLSSSWTRLTLCWLSAVTQNMNPPGESKQSSLSNW